jgi:NADH dehydrogenase
MNNNKAKHHVLVVGGGFGGLKAAQELSHNSNVDVTLLSDRSDFRYYPTMYHTATGGLKRQSSIPLKQFLREDHAKIALGTAEKLDREHKVITTKEGDNYAYDTLILALGSVTNYFGLKGIEKYSYGIKTMDDVLRFKKHLHDQLSQNGRPDEHYVVIGGGPTGIELAGELPHYLHKVMQKHGIAHQEVNVDIIDTSPQLLPRASKQTAKAVEGRLKQLGITMHLGQMVKDQTDTAIITDKESLTTQTSVWTGGMSNNPFFAANEFKLDERKKVIVDEHLKAELDIYVIGDNANTSYAGLAQTAIYDAHFVSKNLEHAQKGEALATYALSRPPTVFPAGPYWAAVEWGKLQMSGIIGWFVRQAADVIGFHDYKPWWPAIRQWSTEFGTEESCTVCTDKATRSETATRIA